MMATFRHTCQLVQLRKLDPKAHAVATRLANGGRVAMADKVIVKAMQSALSRLSGPESNGDSACEICGKPALIQELCPECYNSTQEPATQDEIESCLPPELETIRQQVENTQQWPNGESIEIWRVGLLSLSLKNESGKIKVIAVKEVKRLTDRQINTTTIGIFHPVKGYVVLPDVEDEYNKLIEEME